MSSDSALDAWIRRTWPDDPPPWRRDVFEEMHAEALAEEAKREASSAQARELRDLRRRVATLERSLRPGGAFVDVVAQALGTVMKRVDDLEQKQLRFCGTHEAGATYKAGAMVTRSGGLWCCTKETRGTPGTCDDWQLAVKSGAKSGGLTVA